MLPTIADAAQRIRSRQLSPCQLVRDCLARIAQLEPAVQAWVLVEPDQALEAARQLEQEAERGSWRGPLHGIPIGIKDIIDVYDWPTACGSSRWARSIAREDATVVRRLRHAGAILLGKTVTTPFASFDPPPTRNPWRTDRTPGGSSSGSAAAVACGMCLAALGSQTGGSISRPAAYCGVAGCKPTYGRVSTHGFLPLAPSMDHPGPLARTVGDLALVLQVLAGPDERDPTTVPHPVPDLTVSRPPGTGAPRLGRLHGLFDDRAEPPTLQMMAEVSERLRQAGAVVIDVALPAAFAEVLFWHRTVMAVEAASYHAPRLRLHPEDYPPRIRSLVEEGLACAAPVYARCKEEQARLRRELVACFAELDALLTPAAPGPAPDGATTGDPAFNSPWSFTGLPTVALPAAWSAEGLPLGIQLIGRPWAEAELLATAAWCEACLAFPAREPAPVR